MQKIKESCPIDSSVVTICGFSHFGSYEEVFLNRTELYEIPLSVFDPESQGRILIFIILLLARTAAIVLWIKKPLREGRITFTNPYFEPVPE